MATLERLIPPSVSSSSDQGSAWVPRRAIAVAFLGAATIALLQVAQSSGFTHTGQSMQQLEGQRTQLQAQIHQLEAEVAALSSLERSERAARERLGMVPAPRIQYLDVSVEAPTGALLPRPLIDSTPSNRPETDTWWQAILQSLRIR
jgi:cell division protein FtsL